ncbi:MAG: DUF1080 domain-containing protein [Bacteroidetes bacterium]|nr:DUF1080 domain-containing protein [Bacteroidota bacterium]MBS1974298.1 DUF1080 domain-containing protein [Bacteroidota bacterium]
MIKKSEYIIFLGVAWLVALLFSSCTGTKDQNNQLTEREKQEGWRLLFDGASANGWHLYNNGKIDSQWVAKNGELYCNTNFRIAHQDIITDEEFENFDLKFEWKIATAGNSGVFINVTERNDLATAWASGPEYQLLESSNPDYGVPNKRSGCMFGFASQINAVEPKAQGQWNQSEITQEGGKAAFYLNGILTAQQDFHSPAWTEMIGKTNFSHFPEYGKRTKGHIGLQYWLKGIFFRNIKIKKL